MKIVRVRFTNHIFAFDDDRMPVIHHFHNAEQGLTIEVRHKDHHAFIYGTLEHAGITKHAGESGGYWAHSHADLYYHISSAMFRITEELGLEPHHVWSFIEQLPVFTQNGVDVEEALALSEPIKELLARGASPTEVMESLNVTKEAIEFVLGRKLPPQRLAIEEEEF